MNLEGSERVGHKIAYPHIVFNSMSKDVRGPIMVAMLVEAIPAERTESVVSRRFLEVPTAIYENATAARD